MRWMIALVTISILIVPEVSMAEDVCARIRFAESSGIIPKNFAVAYLGKGATGASDLPSHSDIAAITYDVLTVEKGDSIAKLAEQNYIIPDQYNISLIKKLNPSIKDLSMVQPGDVLALPVPVPSGDAGAVNWGGTPVASGGSLDGFKWWNQYALAPERNEDSSKSLDTMVAQLAELSERFPEARNFDTATSELDYFKAYLNNTEIGTSKAADGDFRIAFNRSLDYLSEVIDTSAKNPTSLTPILVGAVTDAAVENLKGIDRGYVDLTVRTISPENEELPGLRVFFVSDVAYRNGCAAQNKIEFDTRSVNAQVKLRVALWWIFAEDANNRRSVADPLPLTTADDGKRKKDLTIRWEFN